MNDCYIKFKPKYEESFLRTKQVLKIIKSEKESEEVNEENIMAFLSDKEKSYFVNLTPEQLNEWNEFWFSTPVEKRLSSDMPTLGWDLISMYEAFMNGDYEIRGVTESNGEYRFVFSPYGYPYGGTGCMVALLESMGNIVIGIEDGRGYKSYSKPQNIWKPKK